MTVISVTAGVTNSQVVSGGTELIVSSGGTGSGNSILSGGTVIVSSSGLGTSEAVSSGGFLILSSGGNVQFSNVSASGTAIVSGGDYTAGNVLSGGLLIVSSGIAESVAVSSGGLLIVSGGTAKFTDVFSSGTAIVSGGTDGAGNVFSGGLLTVSSGGLAGANNVFGTLIVSSGGSDYADYVSSGGTVIVSGFGIDTADHVSSGAVVSVLDAGSSQNDVIGSGGTLIVSAGGVDSGDTIGGMVIVSSGGTETGATIATSGTLDIVSGAVVSSGVTFAYTDGVLVLNGDGGGLVGRDLAPTQTISAFAASDTIDITGLNSADITGEQFVGGLKFLEIGHDNGQVVVLQFDTNLSADTFTLTSDGNGGTDVTICYYPGTGIRTPAGDVAVEQLKIGDEVVTAEGRILPVRWIGRNTVSTRFADPLRVLPIRIRAGALADNRPERDLLVSPEHAVLVEGILIQAGALVNGLSILREPAVPETFTYYHVELAEHALLLAEGTPAESFVDNIARTAFDNWAEHEALYGDAPIAEMPLPRAQSHRQVPPRIRETILARAQAIGRRAETAA